MFNPCACCLWIHPYDPRRVRDCVKRHLEAKTVMSCHRNSFLSDGFKFILHEGVTSATQLASGEGGGSQEGYIGEVGQGAGDYAEEEGGY